MIREGTATVIVDGQAGSCGKGKVAAYLALKHRPHIAISTFGPNAGHTVYLDGKKLVFRHLPAAAVCPDTALVLAASSIIDPEALFQEIDNLEAAGIQVRNRLHVHPRACIVHEADKLEEQNGIVLTIASTGKGVGAALARKIRRLNANIAENEYDGDYIKPGAFDRESDGLTWITSAMDGGARVLIETSQGYDLCINHGLSYPQCTSRQVSAGQAAADCGMPIWRISDVVGVVRPYPIRVGHVYHPDKENMIVGHSGPYWDDNAEITWGRVIDAAGIDEKGAAEITGRQEITTVTGRLRRVFSFSWGRYVSFIRQVGPTSIFLTFADQIDWQARSATDANDLPRRVLDFVSRLESNGKTPVHYLSTGPETEATVSMFDNDEEENVN